MIDRDNAIRPRRPFPERARGTSTRRKTSRIFFFTLTSERFPLGYSGHNINQEGNSSRSFRRFSRTSSPAVGQVRPRDDKGRAREETAVQRLQKEKIGKQHGEKGDEIDEHSRPGRADPLDPFVIPSEYECGAEISEIEEGAPDGKGKVRPGTEQALPRRGGRRAAVPMRQDQVTAAMGKALP
jgi:hypothetical protein